MAYACAQRVWCLLSWLMALYMMPRLRKENKTDGCLKHRRDRVRPGATNAA